MKFKVGDKVRIRKDLEVGKMYGELNMLDQKSEYLGRLATVHYAWKNDYALDVDAGKWSWNDEMLEAVEHPQRPCGFGGVSIHTREGGGMAIFKVESTEEPDMIQKPPHYNKFSFQPIDMIDEVTNYYEGSTAFHIGTVLKYLCRAPFKGKLLEDLKKANYYLTRAIEEMEEEE